MSGLLNLKKNVAEFGDLTGHVASATFTIGAETASRTISIQLLDGQGRDINYRSAVLAYLSDDANGDSIAANAPSGGVAGGTDGVLADLVAEKVFLLISEADGDIDVVITEAGAATWYLVIVLPHGRLVASAAIVFNA